MYRATLTLACLAESFLALEIAQKEVRRNSSPKKSLATALLATVPSHGAPAHLHHKVVSAENSRPSAKIVQDESSISKPLDPVVAPELKPPAAQQSSWLPASVTSAFAAVAAALPLPALADTGYSQASFYVTLFLFVIAFPGIISLVKRSIKAKIVRNTYEMPGPAAGGPPTQELAANICAFFTANNYKVVSASDVIVFEGTTSPIFGRAVFLASCVFFCNGALALVLSTAEQAVFGGVFLGNFWYLSTLVAPLAGKYYLDNAERTDQVMVKILTEDDESFSDVVVQGDEEEVERFQSTFAMREKGMVYVKGVIG